MLGIGLLLAEVGVAAGPGDAGADPGGGLACDGGASPTCETSGTCLQPYCSVGGGRFQVTEEVVADTAPGGLLWQRGYGPQGDWPTADAYCGALVLEGMGGWRVPSNPELAAIVLRPSGLGSAEDACVPALDQAAFRFPDPAGVLFFWSASAQGGPRPGIRYTRDFSDGRSPRTFEDDPTVFVRCVHDPIAVE